MTDVVDNPDKSRFEVHVDGHTGELVYELDGSRLTLVHTGVPDELEGRGLAGQLVRAAVARARAEELTIVPWCPYARQWLRKHPDEVRAGRLRGAADLSLHVAGSRRGRCLRRARGRGPQRRRRDGMSRPADPAHDRRDDRRGAC